MGRNLFGIFGVNNPPERVEQPYSRTTTRPDGQGSATPLQGGGDTPLWYVPSVDPFWSRMIDTNPNQGSADNWESDAPGPQGSPQPRSDPNYFHRVGNGYPGILPDQRYESEINDGPAPQSYRRYLDCRLMDTVPNRVGGGSSGGNDNDVVAWSLAGQLYGRPPSQIIAQPAGNQEQGVTAVPSLFARRTVG